MHKEILLVRRGFSSPQFCETGDKLNYHYLTERDKLVVAYNNLLLDILPELLEQNSVNKKLCLCKMSERFLLLELKLGEINLGLELQSSIDPYSFMPMQILS